jgi:N-glycosylase/DNA lyase
LKQSGKEIIASTVEPQQSWNWLTDYLQTDVSIEAVLMTFPDDTPLRAAMNSCFGLHVLKQDYWECLASFILSSTKADVARLSEKELRACGMGFRAPYLRESAKILQNRTIEFDRLAELDLEDARDRVMQLPGVGRKIADCFLLFTGLQPRAFPIDVWVMKALQQLYFPNAPRTLNQLQSFSAGHFGPYAGYAQQYLFHHARVHQTSSTKR